MEALLAFCATLVSLRLSADLVRRYRERPAPGPPRLGGGARRRSPPARARSPGARRPAGATRRSASTTSSAACSPRRSSAPARCSGSASAGSAPLTLVYVGLAIGVAIAVPLTAPVSGSSIPEAQAHLDLFPARILAIAANSLGTLAAVVVAADRDATAAARQRADPRRARRGRARKRPRRPRRGGVVALLGRRGAAALRRLRHSLVAHRSLGADARPGPAGAAP